VTDKSIKKLTKLTVMNIEGMYKITYESLKRLTNLTELRIHDFGNDDYNFERMTQLKKLELCGGVNVANYSICGLTGLEFLSLFRNDVTNRDIQALTNLKELYLEDMNNIKRSKLHLPNLAKFVQKK
jgi:hypothetical protein